MTAPFIHVSSDGGNIGRICWMNQSHHRPQGWTAWNRLWPVLELMDCPTETRVWYSPRTDLDLVALTKS